MKPKKPYTGREINEDLERLRAQLGRELTPDVCKTMWPRLDYQMPTSVIVKPIDFPRYNEVKIKDVITSLINMQENGITHVRMDHDGSYSCGDYEIDKYSLEPVARESENDKAWEGRLVQLKSAHIEREVAKRNHELAAQNQEFDTYIKLKDKFESV